MISVISTNVMERRPLLILLLGLTGIVYLNSFPGAFHFDDFALLLENPRVSGPSFPYSSFLEQYGGRPLTFFTFYLNLHLFGNDPSSFHLINWLLHLGVAAFLFLLLEQLFQARALAFVAALLFAIHPLQTQAVNYIWARSFLLMAFFGLTALLLARHRPWLALLFFQLSVWSRTEAVILVIPMSLLNRRFWKIPVLIALANSTLFLYWLEAFQPRDMAWRHPAIFEYWLGQGMAFWKYLGMMLAPFGLSVDHTFPNGPTGRAIFGWLALAVVTGWMFSRRRRFPLIAAGWFWILLWLAPSMLMPNSEPFSESRTYLALAGFTWGVAALWLRFREIARRSAAVALGMTALVSAGITMERNRVWQDDIRLWQEAAAVSPEKARIYYNLGAGLARAGRTGEAEKAFLRARMINPGDDLVAAALGYCRELERDFAAAHRFYREAWTQNPQNDYARDGMERLTSSPAPGVSPEEDAGTGVRKQR